MTAGALLSHYTTPAERLRGAVFAEGFESYDRVIQNGAVFSGAPLPAIDTTNKCATFGTAPSTGQLAYLPMAGPLYMTVSLWFRTTTVGTAERILICHGGWGAASTWRVSLMNTGTGRLRVYAADNAGNVLASYTSGDLGYADNNWHHVGVSVNRPTQAFAITYDGTSLAPGVLGAASSSTLAPYNIVVGGSIVGGGLNFHDGSIRDVKIFNQDLTVAELQQIAAKSVYSYRRRVACYLPMGIAQHDPVNTRTLDVSGNARHATFGAGAEAPTKISGQRGYTFDSTNDYMRTPDSTIAVVPSRTYFIALNSTGTTLQRWFWLARGGSLPPRDLYVYSVLTAGVNNIFYVHNNGAAVVNTGLVMPVGTLQLFTFVTTAANVFIYRDTGELVYTGGAPTIANTGTLISLGADQAGQTDALGGNIYGFAQWDEQLSQLQVMDFHALFQQQINRV